MLMWQWPGIQELGFELRLKDGEIASEDLREENCSEHEQLKNEEKPMLLDRGDWEWEDGAWQAGA